MKTALTLTNIKLATVLALLLVSVSAQAQVFPRGNGIAFTDVERFDAYVNIVDWSEMDADRQQFRLNAQKIFEQGMADVGAPRRVASSDYLVCEVQATRDGRRVAYATSVQFWNMTPVGVHGLQWESSKIGLVSSRSFDEELVASQCVDLFTAEWQKWNTPRT
ncbi:MAG: hypothetical protein R3332_02975 [Pseudohongiellaceae bacterium]|nr:hypothetical protein [Pseudohongiellaceae bacterium]